MAAYDLLISPSAAKDLDRISRASDRRAVVRKITALATEPRPGGCRKLAGGDGWYRIRQGRYRIVYSVEDARLVVLVIRIGDRKEVYRGLGDSSPGGRSRPFEP
ncbi:MAG: type II toxin-antitoxin system RelE/ParE family toxin [Acidobacteria bacterium]|nr:type II toxin-antitoxin system RelE/ParE family toxin [Acidobacteriota bacterium]